MRAAVNDVEGGDGQDDLGLASKIGNVLVERDALGSGTGLGNGEGDTKDRVSAELGCFSERAQKKKVPVKHYCVGVHLFSVPSSSSRNLSTSACLVTSKFFWMRAGAIMVLTLSTAVRTPLPRYLVLSLSRSSRAS